MIAIFESTDRRCSTRVYILYIHFLQTFFFLKLSIYYFVSRQIRLRLNSWITFFFFVVELPLPIPFCQGIQKTVSYWWNIIFKSSIVNKHIVLSVGFVLAITT